MTKAEKIDQIISKMKKPKKEIYFKKEKSVYRDSLAFMQNESDLDFYSLNPKWEFNYYEKT